MRRWVFPLLCFGVLAAVGGMEPSRNVPARALGGVCESTAACEVGLTCEQIEGVLDGQCSAPCNTDAACQETLGARAICIGPDRCVLACERTGDCPVQTTCNAFGWCERQKLDG